MSEDLWGDISTGSTMKLPVTILKEQATILGEKTNKILEGKVIQTAASEKLINYDFIILAPALSNYQFKVLHITHSPILVYPVTISFENESGAWASTSAMENEGRFKAMLGRILSSKNIHKVIESLIAQSKAAT